MGGGGSSKGGGMAMPEVKPAEVPTALPTLADESVQHAGDEERRKRAAAYGANSTVMTGASGLKANTAQTAKKTMLGG